MKLLIHLKNSPGDLAKITGALEKNNINVEIDEGAVILATSILTDGDIDISDKNILWTIRERTANLINIINGSIIAVNISANKLEINFIKYEDNCGKNKYLEQAIKIGGKLIFFGGAYADISHYIELSLIDKRVEKILRLFSKELDWVNICRIIELLQEDGFKFSDKSRIDILTGSANNSSVAGDDARHGWMNSKIPKKIMNLDDAQELIKDEVSLWILNKVNTK